jgi:ABC-type multidrug transport system fused ATPase/permease subunit
LNFQVDYLFPFFAENEKRVYYIKEGNFPSFAVNRLSMSQKEGLKKENKFDIRGFWKRLWELLDFVHPQIKKLAIFIIFIELFRLLGPYILKLIIDQITNFSPEKIGKLVLLIIAMFLANQVVSIMAYFEDRRIIRILADVESGLNNNAQRNMVFLDLNYHERENTGNKILKISRGIMKIVELLGNFFWEVFPTIFQIIFTAIVLFLVDYRFGLTIVLFIPIFILLTLRINRQVYPLRLMRHDKQEEASGKMAQSIININTVKSFVQEVRECNSFNQVTNVIKESVIKEYSKILRYNLRRNLVIDLGRAIILGSGIYLVWKGNMTIGSLVFIFTISEKALISLYRITRLYDRIMDSSEAIERVYDLKNQEPTIKNPEKGIKVKNIEGQIEFQNVSFKYDESRLKALDKVTLKINSSCVTALVGPSGGGKTTLARMIYRHYDPAVGAVLLDGIDLKKYDLYSFRRFISIVPQEVEIFNSSVRDNISYAKPLASFKEIQAAARIANAEEFINQLSDGYNTLVGERGIKLSGGQRQRVGIARAILANPKILIFDEATSSLDSYSERLIQEAMEKVSRGRTVIIIAHRLSTIKRADKIVVLEKGKVVEEGSHFELARVNGGLYQRLIRLQEMGDVE